MKRIKMSGYFARHALVAAVAILLSLLLLSLWVITNGERSGRDTILGSENALFLQGMGRIENSMDEFCQISRQISVDNFLTPYKLQQNNYDTLEALAKIKYYRERDSNLLHIFLVLNSKNTLYGSFGIETYETFAESRCGIPDGEERDALWELINNKGKFAAYKVGDAGENVLYKDCSLILYPLGINEEHVYGTLMGVYESDFFEKNLQETAMESKSLILNYEGEIICETMPELVIPSEELRQVVYQYDPEQQYYKVMYDNAVYVAIVHCSDLTGWYYLRLISDKELSSIYWMENIGFISVLVSLSLFLSCICGIVLGACSYSPIRSLLQLCFVDLKQDDMRDELKMLNEYIIRMKERVVNAENLLRETRLRDACISLLCGKQYLVSENRKLLEKLIQEKKVTGIRVVIFLIDSLEYMEIENEFCGMKHDNLRYVMQKPTGCYVFLYLHVHESRDFMEEIRGFWEKVTKEGYCVRVGIGRKKERLEELTDSLDESMTALEYDLLNSIVVFETLVIRNSNMVWEYPGKEEMLLQCAIEQGNTEKILKAAEKMRECLVSMTRYGKEREIQYVLHRITNHIVKFPNVSKELNVKYVKKLLNYRGVIDYFQILQEYVEQAAKEAEAICGTRGQYIVEIVSFIDQNYCDSQMGLVYVAEHFGIGETYLSKIFKESTGCNFLDYITEKRMERSKYLLLNTDMKIMDIVKQVGYEDVPAFTRKFSKKYGVSPGVYRKMAIISERQ